MFQVNDIVRYGMNGVCRISEAVLRAVGNEQKEYFVLRPVHDERSTLFVPLDNAVLMGKMQTVLSKGEVLQLIEQMPTLQQEWIVDENQRRSIFREMMVCEDRLQLIGMIKVIYERERVLREQGKKLRLDDEKALRTAEKLLYDEFAYVLEIPRSDVVDYIKKAIRDKNK